MAVVYAIPYKPPVPYKPDWGGVTVTWTGWDGSVWNLSDPSGGVFLPQSGVGGLSMPSYTQWTQQSPSVAGQWFRGAVADPRKVFWPIAVYSDKDSSAWLALDSAFWNSMHPEKYGTWTVTNPLGQSRTLRLRFSDDGNNTFDTNPARIGWAVYGINMIADQPFWSGEPVTQSWGSPKDPVDFYGGSAKAAPYYIMSSSTFSSATMTNPGTEDAWLTWTIIGDSTSAHVGVGGKVIDVPFTVPVGKALVINTHPTAQTATLYDYNNGDLSNPVDKTADLGNADFARIPAGGSQPLSISVTGSAIVTASFTPLYRRAW